MSGLVIDPKKCTRCGLCITQCPFNAMAMVDGQVQINAACKMCRMCLRNCPSQAISEQVDAPQPQIDKSQWHDILVYVEHSDGRIHPVTLELIGKAHELARVIGQQVNCLMIGDHIEQAADSLLDYGVANVYLYEDARLQYFRADNYTEVFEDCIQRSHPAVVLSARRSAGRSLAPRTAGALPHRLNGRLYGSGNAGEYRSGADPACFRRQHHGSDSEHQSSSAVCDGAL